LADDERAGHQNVYQSSTEDELLQLLHNQPQGKLGMSLRPFLPNLAIPTDTSQTEYLISDRKLVNLPPNAQQFGPVNQPDQLDGLVTLPSDQHDSNYFPLDPQLFEPMSPPSVPSTCKFGIFRSRNVLGKT